MPGGSGVSDPSREDDAVGAEEDEIERRSRVMAEAMRFSPWGRHEEPRVEELDADDEDSGDES